MLDGPRAGVVTLLIAALLIGGPARAATRPRMLTQAVLLFLPGARLSDLTGAGVPHLTDLVHRSSGAWVVAWRPLKLPAGHGQVLPVPLRRDPARPFGVRADGAAIRRRARAALQSTELLSIDPGDLERAESYAPLCLPAKAREHRMAALKAMDELVGTLGADPQIRDLWLLAPPLKSGPGLVPFFWLQRGRPPGLFRSGSTHMVGVITGADLSTTLAGLVGAAAPRDSLGLRIADGSIRNPQSAIRNPQSRLAALRRLAARAEHTDQVRAVANRLVQWFLLLLIVAGAIALRADRRLPEAVALAPLLLPALLLLDGAWRGGHRMAAAVILLLILAAVAWTYCRNRSRRQRGMSSGSDWSALAAATVAACGVALLAGDVFRWAVLGYSIRLGARFYGVGNEYMGWWIGAALLVGGPSQRVRPGVVGLLLGVALLIGHPRLGGKVGGEITALAALAVELWPVLRQRRALAFGIVGVAVAAIFALAAWDAAQPADTQTHLGRLVTRVIAEGPRPFFALAGGKLLTELRVTLSLWGILLAAGAWLILQARRHAPEAAATRVVSRLLPAAAVAYLCNDSGVIAAALMLSYGVLAAADDEVMR
jgi:hypothetical protein